MFSELWKSASAKKQNKNMKHAHGLFVLSERKVNTEQVAMCQGRVISSGVLDTDTVSLSVRMAPFSGNEPTKKQTERLYRTGMAVDFDRLVDSEVFQEMWPALRAVAGQDVDGKPVVLDLEQTTPMVVVGVNSQEKAKFLKSVICSILLGTRGREVRLLLIDPKMRDGFYSFQQCPHLWTPVVTDAAKAVLTLQWLEAEVESRLLRRSKAVSKGEGSGEDTIMEKPIVVVVSELTDLVIEARGVVEAVLHRIIPKASSIGVHIIIGIQCLDMVPVTLLGKKVSRCVFQVFSPLESVTVLGELGAEKLQGVGDGYLRLSGESVQRVYAPDMGEKEIMEVVQAVR